MNASRPRLRSGPQVHCVPTVRVFPTLSGQKQIRVVAWEVLQSRRAWGRERHHSAERMSAFVMGDMVPNWAKCRD